MRNAFLLGVLASLLCLGCVPPASGAFAPDAYHEEQFPVRATYAVAATRQIPTGDWILMNYQFKNSLPGQPKVTGDIEYRFDTDGDGSLDTTQTVKRYSLEYHHATTGAEMVFSLAPLSVEDARLDLSVLAANYVERSSGSGTVAISIGPGVAIEHTKKYASRILDARATTVGGLPAYVVTFDLANVDQLGLSPDSRWRRARVIFIRTPYRWVLEKGSHFFGDWPVVGVIEYDADPKDFDAHLAELGSLVGRLEFMDDQRVIRAHANELMTCTEAASATFAFDIGPMGIPYKGYVDSKFSGCAGSHLDGVRFAPLNSARTATARLDRAPQPALSSTAVG
jgi:hypothetical protein